MLSNYLKIAFRNLKKYRFFNGINILGLSLAIAISVLLFSTALREFSYDQFHANKEDIHLLYFKKNRPEGVELSRTMAAPIVPTLKEEFPELKATRWLGRSAEIKYGASKHRFGVDFADEDFFSMFSFPIIKGNTTNPLTELNAVVINEEVATIIFGEEDPIGKILPFSFDGRIVDLVVTAIIGKYPAESTLNFNMLTRFENSNNYQAMRLIGIILTMKLLSNYRNKPMPLLLKINYQPLRKNTLRMILIFWRKVVPKEMKQAQLLA